HRAGADFHGRDQLGVAADKHAVLNDGLSLSYTVIITRDCSCANIHTFSDFCVPQVAQMIGFRPFAQFGLLRFDEIADLGALPDEHVRTQMSERTNHGIILDTGVATDAMIENFDSVADRTVGDPRPGTNDDVFAD